MKWNYLLFILFIYLMLKSYWRCETFKYLCTFNSTFYTFSVCFIWEWVVCSGAFCKTELCVCSCFRNAAGRLHVDTSHLPDGRQVPAGSPAAVSFAALSALSVCAVCLSVQHSGRMGTCGEREDLNMSVLLSRGQTSWLQQLLTAANTPEITSLCCFLLRTEDD